MYKRDYAFRMNVMQEIFEIRSCIALFTELIKSLYICMCMDGTGIDVF